MITNFEHINFDDVEVGDIQLPAQPNKLNYPKIIICGDRAWSDAEAVLKVYSVLKLYENPVTKVLEVRVIEGGADGIDEVARKLCNKLKIKYNTIEAKWAQHGKKAGPLRNQSMLRMGPTAVYAFHKNIADSRGTKDCIAQAKELNIPVKLIS